MYIVRLDDKKIYDQRVDDLTLIEPVVELEENNAGSFSFTITSTHPYFNDIKCRSSVITVYEDSDLLFSGMVYEIQEDFYRNRKVYCEGELSYLNDTIQRPAEYHNMTIRGLLEAFIDKHNAQVEPEKQFKVGMITVPETFIYCYTNMENTLKCIKEDLLDDLGGIIRVRHSNGEKYIDYIAETDVNTNSQVIRLGENLIDYKSNLSSLEIASAIIPLGAKLEESPIEALEMRLDIKSVNNGFDYVADGIAVNTFGRIYKVVVWDDVKDATILKQKGELYLSNTQFDNLVIEVNALDMHLIDSDEKPFRLSDQILIISRAHGLRNKYFRLTRQTINLNNPENNTITLGKEEQVTLSERTVQANNDVMKAIEKITPASTILKQAQENATQIITNALGGYVVFNDTNDDGHPDEILVMDTADTATATRVWRWNQNGLGYSNTGYNGSYGLAMTMDGAIVADFITTGTLVGLEINNGNGTFKVDPQGNLSASNANISGTVSGSTITGSTTMIMRAGGSAHDTELNWGSTWGDSLTVVTNTNKDGGLGVCQRNHKYDRAVYIHYNDIRLYDDDYNPDYAQWGSKSSSDIRLKKNIKKADKPSIRKLFKKLNFVSFNYIDDESEKTEHGMIAQEVEPIIEELGFDKRAFIKKDSDDFYKLTYSNFERLGMIAIQDLYEIIENQQKEINELKERSKKQ